MLLRMIMHSAVFTIAIAVGAVAMNDAGMLSGAGYGNARWASSGYMGGHDRKRGGHDDDWDHDDD